jgi:RNA polymerase sigma factor (sigma-70 family)
MEQIKTLIHKCKKGDARAQGALFELYKRKWMGICARYVKDGDEAKDVFQDAAIKIFKDIGKLQDPDAFEGWARRIMINHALNDLRKKKMYVLMLQEYKDSNDDSGKTDVEAIQRMDSVEVLALINQLPDGYRLVLNLALVDGYKHAEIASLLSIAESTSRSQLNKARKSLQRLIENLKIKENARIAG